MAKKSKYWMQAPLPFTGQKRQWIATLDNELDNIDLSGVDTIVDLFGGSGLMSRFMKDKFPDKKVIYNDYENYRERIRRIPETNVVLEKLRVILDESGIAMNARITDENVRDQIYEVVKDVYDWRTIFANIFFSGPTPLPRTDKRYYNRVVKNNYKEAMEYFDGLEIVSCDYQELIKQYNGDNVLYICDPPYLMTDNDSYKKNNEWKLTDYLEIIRLISINSNSFIYFTCEKTGIIEFIDWLELNFGIKLVKGKSKILGKTSGINYNAKNNDQCLISYNKAVDNNKPEKQELEQLTLF